MAEPTFIEGLSDEEIERLAAWMMEREASQYYAGGHLPWGPTRQAIPQSLKAQIPTQLRAMSRQQKLAKAAQALASIDPQTLGEIAPQAYMAKQIIESIKLPSAEPAQSEIPQPLQQQWGTEPTKPPAQEEALEFGPSAPTRMMGGRPTPWEVTGTTPESAKPTGFTPPAELSGLSGRQRRLYALQQMANLAAQGKDQVYDENTGKYGPSPEYNFWMHQASIGELEEEGGAGGMTAYQAASLGLQQQQLELERERIRQAMIGLGMEGAGQIGTLTQQGANLAKEAALYSLPPGALYARGFEPGGLMESIYAGFGTPYTARPAARTPVNPYAGAQQAVPMIQKYLQQLGLGG